jgi:thiol:disulfide interchange protein DsbC
MSVRIWLSACALVASNMAAHADEASVKAAFQSKLQVPVVSVTKTPLPGIYEVFTGKSILYTDESASYVLSGGDLIDVKGETNLTEARMRKLTAISFDALPLDLAFKKVKGNGKRKLAYFADPNCGYCKRFEREVNEIDNVTVYMFLYPILTPDSVDKAKAVWCSNNRAKAWDDLMQRGVAPVGQANCASTPVDKILAYGKKMNISGTPTLIFADGSRVPGAIGGDQLREFLDSASR